MLPRPLSADQAICRVYAAYVSQEPICESSHAASMPRRNAGVLNAFDLQHQKNQLGRVWNRSDASLGYHETLFVDPIGMDLDSYSDSTCIFHCGITRSRRIPAYSASRPVFLSW